MAPEPTPLERDDIVAAIKSSLLTVLGSTASTDLIDDDTNLFDIGIDSMNMTELLLDLERRFDLTLAPEDLSADIFLRFHNLVSFVQSHVRQS